MDNSEKSIRDIIRVLFAEERIHEGTKDLLHKHLDEMMKSTTWEESFVKIIDRVFKFQGVPAPSMAYRKLESATHTINANRMEYEITVVRKQQ